MLGLIEVNIGCDACSVIDIDALGRWHDRRAGSDDSPVHHAAHDESDEAGKDVAEDVRHGGMVVGVVCYSFVHACGCHFGARAIRRAHSLGSGEVA